MILCAISTDRHWWRTYCKSSTNKKHSILHLFSLSCLKPNGEKHFQSAPFDRHWLVFSVAVWELNYPMLNLIKVQLRGFSFCDVIWAIQYSLYLLSIFCQFSGGTHRVRWRCVSLVSSRYGGFGVGWPRRSVCGKRWWLCGALQRLSACPFGLRQARIHSSYSWKGQRTGQNTPFDSPCNTLVCVGVDETGYFVGLW